jgi:hypothetical protein
VYYVLWIGQKIKNPAEVRVFSSGGCPHSVLSASPIGGPSALCPQGAPNRGWCAAHTTVTLLAGLTSGCFCFFKGWQLRVFWFIEGLLVRLGGLRVEGLQPPQPPSPHQPSLIPSQSLSLSSVSSLRFPLCSPLCSLLCHQRSCPRCTPSEQLSYLRADVACPPPPSPSCSSSPHPFLGGNGHITAFNEMWFGLYMHTLGCAWGLRLVVRPYKLIEMELCHCNSHPICIGSFQK